MALLELGMNKFVLLSLFVDQQAILRQDKFESYFLEITSVLVVLRKSAHTY